MPAKRAPAAKRPKPKRRSVAAKSAVSTKKTTKPRRKKTATATTSKVTKARKAKASIKKKAVNPARKTISRRKKTTTGTGIKRRAATARKKPVSKVGVKKKPSKLKVIKKTSTASRAKAKKKTGANKKTTSKRPLVAARTGSKKKHRPVQSSSQVYSVLKQQPSEELNMTESKNIQDLTKERANLFDESQLLAPNDAENNSNVAPYKEKPGEDYMSPTQQSHFRGLLLLRKKTLLKDGGKTVNHLKDEGTALADISDRATQEEEFNLELRARDRERKLIKKIDDALQQLDEGRYGFCDTCGVEIGLRRLEARPTATLCIDCKTLDEIREKQTGG